MRMAIVGIFASFQILSTTSATMTSRSGKALFDTRSTAGPSQFSHRSAAGASLKEPEEDCRDLSYAADPGN